MPTSMPTSVKGAQQAEAAGRYSIEAVDPGDFTLKRFGRFRHNYGGHPLLQLERLAKLAHDLMPYGKCRFIARDTTDSSEFFHTPTPADGRSLEEVFSRIEDPGSWIAMYNVEVMPEYQAFLWEVLASAGELITREEAPYEVRGFIFISAPPSVTPFHIDRENNFWMNLRGRKTIGVWDREDRSIVSQPDIERFLVYRSLDNVKLTDAVRAKAHEFDCGPGDGVYFPSTTPHLTRSDRSWTRPGDGVSVSMGIDFYTNVTRQASNVHAWNQVLRGFGVSPRYPGMNAWIDRVKYPLGRAAIAARRLRGYVPPPGFV